jgi:N-acetylglucosaminyl-diphospho-decaprenol L-rhamnosyltransferase
MKSRESSFVPGNDPKSLSIVLVAHESAHVIVRALNSVGDGHEVICIDNGSTDNLRKVLEGRYVTYVRNETNLGFASACNQAATIAAAELILFINPDVILAPDAIECLLLAASKYDDADVFVPRTILPSGDTWFHDVSTLDDTTTSRKYWGKSLAGDCCIRFVDGGVFLIRKKTFMELDGFDENIFLYFEDDDLTLRLLAKGKTIIHVHQAVAVHQLGHSTRRTLKGMVLRAYHKKRSEYYVKRKYGWKLNMGADFRSGVFKLIYYAMTLKLRRAAQSYGGLMALASMRRGHPPEGATRRD